MVLKYGAVLLRWKSRLNLMGMQIQIPLYLTSESARQLHREIATKHKPKDAVFMATQQQGGEIEARGMSPLPRNRQQIANY